MSEDGVNIGEGGIDGIGWGTFDPALEGRPWAFEKVGKGAEVDA